MIFCKAYEIWGNFVKKKNGILPKTAQLKFESKKNANKWRYNSDYLPHTTFRLYLGGTAP